MHSPPMNRAFFVRQDLIKLPHYYFYPKNRFTLLRKYSKGSFAQIS